MASTILLHVCCAPCFATAMATLRNTQTPGFSKPDGIFFYNPNIHPLLEFRRRVKALRVYLERDPVSAEIDDTYGLQEFLTHFEQNGGIPKTRRDRCMLCYALRLGRTAARAAEQGYGAITTTLLASREQDRDLVAEAGKAAAAKHGVEFLQADLRAVLPEEKVLRGIYKQQYCGCIFSEEERFQGTNKHLSLPGASEQAPAPDMYDNKE